MLSKQLQVFKKQLLAHDVVAVIDLEATCYDSFAEKQTYLSEVIEVGWVLYHIATGEITNKESFYVKPTTSIVTPFCTELTGITAQQVADAPSFTDVMRQLKKHHEHHGVKLWLSQGNYDRRKLMSQCEAEGAVYPFDDHEWINIKTIARHRLDKKNRLGLKSLLEDLNLPLEGRQHSGADDANNSARVLRELLAL